MVRATPPGAGPALLEAARTNAASLSSDGEVAADEEEHVAGHVSRRRHLTVEVEGIVRGTEDANTEAPQKSKGHGVGAEPTDVDRVAVQEEGVAHATGERQVVGIGCRVEVLHEQELWREHKAQCVKAKSHDREVEVDLLRKAGEEGVPATGVRVEGGERAGEGCRRR